MQVLEALLRAVVAVGERCVVVSTSTAALDAIDRLLCKPMGWAGLRGGAERGGGGCMAEKVGGSKVQSRGGVPVMCVCVCMFVHVRCVCMRTHAGTRMYV